MAKVNNFTQGLFILGALALGAAMLFFFGVSDIFVRKAHLVTYFSESVQGLAVGSPVKYKGVTIGDVRAITIRVEDKIIRVDMDVQLKVFSKGNAQSYRDQAEFAQFLNKEITEGLRSRLEYAGITGLRYIELDYYAHSGDTPKWETSAANAHDELLVPSTPSVFKDLLKSLNTSLERISKMRFEEISDNLVSSLSDINRLLSSPEIRDTITHLKGMAINLDRTSGAINKVVTEEKLRQTLDLVDATLTNSRNLAAELEKQLKSAQIEQTSAAFRQTAVDVGDAAQVLVNRRRELDQTMLKLRETLDSLRELLNLLNQDPSALLRGKQGPVMSPEN